MQIVNVVTKVEILPKTINSGTGKTLRVADAGYFTDGFGIVEGDTIRVGSNPAVRIMNINYSTNEITVDRNISWSSNNGVNLDFSGARPDMGVIDATSINIAKPTYTISSQVSRHAHGFDQTNIEGIQFKPLYFFKLF